MQFSMKEDAIRQTNVHGFSEDLSRAYVSLMGVIWCLRYVSKDGNPVGGNYINLGAADNIESAACWLTGENIPLAN